MPIQVMWDTQLPQTILYTFDTFWTWEEYLTAFMQEQTMGRSLGDAPYFTIADLTHARLVPHGPLFRNLTYTAHTSPPNFQHAYLVSNSTFIANLMKVTIQAVPHLAQTMSLVFSMDEARSHIQAALSVH
jgi:hypothetical protein